MPRLRPYIITSVTELFIIVFYSTLPISIALILSLLSKSSVNVQEFTQREFGGGQLILLSLALCSGIVYSIVKTPPVRWRNFFFLYCGLLGLVAVVAKCVASLSSLQPGVVQFSYFVAGVTLVVLYINLYFNHKAVSNPASLLKTQEANYLDSYAKRRSGM